MKKNHWLKSVAVAILICALLLASMPAAFASCKDSDGNEYDEHDWGDWITVSEPTCSDAGKKVKTCNRCGKEKEEEIEKLGHDWTDWSTVSEPTCSDPGKKVKTCNRCGKEKEEEIEKLGHDWTDWSTVSEPTCSDAGKRVKTCNRCGAEKEEEIEKLGHDWTDWSMASEPTCEDAGRRVKTCNRCGAQKEEEIEKLGHDWGDWSTASEPTCEDAGRRVKTCNRCGAQKEEEIEKLGHDWSDWNTVSEPTCSDAGKKVKTCNRCGAEKEEEIEKLGHEWGDWSKVSEPTCTAAGQKSRVCARCGAEQTEDGDAALGHSYEAQKTEPTCEDDGVITYTCSRCGDSYTEAGDAALGHDWGEWVETPATETAPGMRSRVCNRCGAEEVEETDEVYDAARTAAGEKYLIRFLDGDGSTVLQSSEVAVGETPVYNGGTTPSKAADENYTYTWNSEDPWTPAIAAVTAAQDYTPNFIPTLKAATVTITFVCGEGAQNVPEPITGNPGDIIDASKIISPTRANFTFTGWDPAVPSEIPTADLEITAQWKANVFSIDPLEPVECHTFKPAIDDALNLLPVEATVYLGDDKDKKNGQKATLVWSKDSCPTYGDKADDASGNGTYTFTAVSVTDKDSNAYTLNEGIQATCDFVVGPDTSADFQYQLNADGKAVIVGWTGSAPSDGTPLIVPAKLDDHDVIAIGDEAFKGKADLKLVTLPVGIVAIGRSAFEGSGLTSLEVPAGVRTIGDAAFANCASLASLTLPDTLNTIGLNVVLNDLNLMRLTLSASLPSTMDSTTSYTRAPLEGETGNEEGRIAVTLPMAVTDIAVYSPAATPFTLGCAYTVEPGNSIIVAAGAGMNANATQTNSGSIDVGGTLTLNNTLDNRGVFTAEEGAMVTAATVTNSGSINDGGAMTLNGALTNSGGIDVSGAMTLSAAAANTGSVTVQKGATLTVSAICELRNTGKVANSGTVDNAGKIITCNGKWSGSKPSGGGTFFKDHDYELNKDQLKKVCKNCGHEEAVALSLKVAYTGPTLSKVYDKSKNYQKKDGTWLLSDKLNTKYFTVTKDGDYSAVSIKSVSLSLFSGEDAGDYKLSAKVYIKGDDAKYYADKGALKQDDKGYYYPETVKIPAKITKKPVVITPSEVTVNNVTYKLSKVYGQKDPALIGFTQTGLLNLTEEEKAAGKKLYTGKLTREKGENAGTYKISMGTLDFGNANYEVTLVEKVFTIEQKDINATDVGLLTIGNQKYEKGKACKPAITLRYGTLTLKQDTDFKVEYKDNDKPGTAKVKLTGIGNFTGTRDTKFTIYDVKNDFKKGSSGSGSYSYSGFDKGEFEDQEDGDEEGDKEAVSEVGALVLNNVNYGTVLFGPQGDAKPFSVFEDKPVEAGDEIESGTDEDAEDGVAAEPAPMRTLTIVPDPMVDEATGDSLFLADGIRERYSELHLRLDTALVQKLMQDNVGEIIYELEQAELHIPLASLISEIPLESLAMVNSPEAGGQPVAEGTPLLPLGGQTPVDDAAGRPVAEGTPLVPTDELVLEDAGEEIEDEVEEVGGDDGAAADESNVLKVQTYDIWVEQADATGLTGRETALLQDSRLMVPAYRLRVRVVPEGTPKEPTGLTYENGEPITQAPAQELPEGFYPQGLVLNMVPDQSLEVAPEGAQSVYISIIDQPEDDDESAFTPATFAEAEGALVASIPVEANGLYAVAAPEGWAPAENAADAAEEAGEDEFEAEDFEEEDSEEDDFEEEDSGEDDGDDSEFEEIV